MKNNLEIVQYNDNYAAQIAEMWSHSVEGWNGEVWDSTEQSVRESENNSTHLQLSLAKEDELIVGYCKLSVDHNDTGALYIDLLNVRDDYHGKKIGKKLVLDAVNKTTELKWPRVDLYTWAGNLKAVPLYKRCGFFWEKKDGESTHLINMIPTILQTELFEDFFKEADWYDDSRREIIVEPDGNEENKFNIWTYSWEKNGKSLEIDFTRRGRGIRRVETDDYCLTAIVEDLNLVFGKRYVIKYEVVNKSGKNLQIDLTGQNDRNITYDFEKSVQVVDRESFSGEFYVGTIEKNQPENQTHPSVITNIKINGKEVQFKTGIVPKYPLTVKLINPYEPSKTVFPDYDNDLYLDVENHFKNETEFAIDLPDSGSMKIIPNRIQIRLKGEEKRSLALKCRVKENCTYSPMVPIEVKGEESFTFETEVSELFRTGFGAFAGECRSKLEIGISDYFLVIHKDKNHSMFFGNAKHPGASVHIKPPKLGLPFSDEFEHKEWDKYEFDKGNGYALLKLFYASESFKGISFIRHLKLLENGILERWFTMTNSGDEVCPSLSIADSLYLNGFSKIFPYDGQFVTADFDNDSNIQAWNFEKFTENWLYSAFDKFKIGLVWSDEHQVKTIDEKLNIISAFETIQPGESRESGVVAQSFDVFDDWNGFREFALKTRLEKEVLTPSTELIINGGNPFTPEEFDTELKAKGPNSLKGKLQFKNSEVELNDQSSHKMTTSSEAALTVPEYIYRKPESIRTYKKAVFTLSKENVTYRCEKGVHSADNGILEIKGDENFAPSIFSLKYAGHEWLHSNYPEITAQSWWNPWVGGLFTYPKDLPLVTVLEEKCAIRKIEKKDNLGNLWSGLAIQVDIEKKHDKIGSSFTQHFLMMPGAPVLATYCEFSYPGVYSNHKSFQSEYFYKSGDDIQKMGISYDDEKGRMLRFNPGKSLNNGEALKELYLSNNDRREKIHLTNGRSGWKGYYCDTNLALIWFIKNSSAEAGKTGITDPSFHIFSEETLTKETLSDLDKIRFEIQ